MIDMNKHNQHSQPYQRLAPENTPTKPAIDIEELTLELRRRALMADDNMGDSEAFDNAANALDSLQAELENVNRRFNLLMNALRSVYDSLDKSVTQCRELQKENKEIKNRIGSSQS